MISPLPVEQEQLVVVEIIDGVADTTLVHLPAVQCHGGGLKFHSFDFPPATWPPACQQIRSGAVYVRAGMLADAVVCPDCEAA